MERDEALRRWRLVLGAAPDDAAVPGWSLDERDTRIDAALSELYDDRKAGRGASAPYAMRWLGEMRELFPQSVQIDLQRDALDRFGVAALLADPMIAEQIEPDVALAAHLLNARHAVSDAARAQVRRIIERLVDDLEQRFRSNLQQAARGALTRSRFTARPAWPDVDWGRTIHRNLQHYQAELHTVVPASLVGHPRRRRGISRELHLCVDQSGSMGTSVVYSGVFACALASVPALRTSFVAYDTAVVDLTEHLSDPVELLFGTQLGGGTDTAPALRYCRSKMQSPGRSTLILISDLYDSDLPAMLAEIEAAITDGVRVCVIAAVNDTGTAAFERNAAEALAGLGVSVVACTPDRFVDLVSEVLA